MNDIFELLNIKALNEEDQEKVKQKIQDIIDLKVNEQVTEKLEEEKQSLVEKYEQKFETFSEDYKKELVEHLSNFIDRIIEKELVIPDMVMEWARKGELYHDAIETLKTRMAIDEGMIESEVKDMLKEAKETLDERDEEINEATKKNLEMEKDLRLMAAELYVRKQTDGLSEDKKIKAINLLSGTTDKEEIDRKLKIIIGSKDDEISEEKEVTKNSVNEDKNDDSRGKGHAVVDNKVNEDKVSSPWFEWLESTMTVK
jgi:hypothetical protein